MKVNPTVDDLKTNGKTSEPDDFSEYLWMENEEEFEQEVMKQLEEEALMEQCIQAMLEDERENNAEQFYQLNPGLLNGIEHLELNEEQQERQKTEMVNNSKLNPNAAEFVPRGQNTGKV